MKLVIDTSILIDSLRGGTASKHFFGTIASHNPEFFIPTIVIFELYCGVSSAIPPVRVKISSLINQFKRIELTEETAIHAGELYRKIGKQISPQDYIIAASAISLNAQVVTLNTKHFEKIPGLKLYSI